MNYKELLHTYPALHPYLDHMPAEIRSAFTLRALPPGFLIHQKDALLETVGILCEGTLKVVNEFDTGNAYMIEYDHAVDFIGDVALLAEKEKTSVTIETVTDCAVLLFSRPDFELWLAEDPYLLRLMAKRVACKLYNSSYNHGAELFYSSPRLLLEFLRRYAGEHPPDDQGTVRVADTRQELSEQLGMLPKTVDRTVKRLKEAGLISTSKGKICMNPAQRAAIVRRLAEWIE